MKIFNMWLHQIEKYINNQNMYTINFNNILKNISLHGRKYTIYGQSYINPLNTM